MALAPLFPLLHQLLSPLFPHCLWQGNRADRAIALTFDDGPHPQYTPPLLEVLDHYQVRASFFWLGRCVEQSPHLAQTIVARGHWIGLHGYDHRSFPTLTLRELRQSLSQTQTAIARACSLQPQQLRDVRPPNGLFTPPILNHLKLWGYRPVMWSVVPEDWIRPGIEVVTRRVLQQTGNGSIIVLHDGHCGGADVATVTEQILSVLIPQGYEFLTIDQLWGHTQPAGK